MVILVDAIREKSKLASLTSNVWFTTKKTHVQHEVVFHNHPTDSHHLFIRELAQALLQVLRQTVAVLQLLNKGFNLRRFDCTAVLIRFAAPPYSGQIPQMSLVPLCHQRHGWPGSRVQHPIEHAAKTSQGFRQPTKARRLRKLHIAAKTQVIEALEGDH